MLGGGGVLEVVVEGGACSRGRCDSVDVSVVVVEAARMRSSLPSRSAIFFARLASRVALRFSSALARLGLLSFQLSNASLMASTWARRRCRRSKCDTTTLFEGASFFLGSLEGGVVEAVGGGDGGGEGSTVGGGLCVTPV